MTKGRIKAEWCVFCGICYDFDHLDWLDARSAGGRAGLARQKGWKLTKLNGWVCPRCQPLPPMRAWTIASKV